MYKISDNVCSFYGKYLLSDNPQPFISVLNTNYFPVYEYKNLFFQYNQKLKVYIYENEDGLIILSGTFFNFKGEDLSKNLDHILPLNTRKLNLFVKKLNGRFLVIYLDKRTKNLNVYNDHMGLQSVYYLIRNNCLWFCDKLAPLMHCDRHHKPEFNWLKSLSFSETDDVFSNSSLLLGVHLLRGGHFIETLYTSSQTITDSYWDFNEPIEPYIAKDSKAYVDELKFLLEDAVNIRSNQNDSTNIFLSGGLDSSAVAWFAQKKTLLKGFSILNPLTFQTEDTERAFALAKQLSFDIDFFLLTFNSLNVSPEEWELLIRVTETPVLDLSHLIKLEIYHTLVQKNSLSNNRFLTGFGSDQFLGGITRTTLNTKGIGFDNENHWDSYHEIIKRNHLDFYLDKSTQYAGNLYAYINIDYFKEKEKGFRGNAWHFQMFKSQYAFTKKTIIPEINIASHFNQEILFPYLDPRLITFIASIPKHLYQDLLFDKMILRKIFNQRNTFTGVNDPKTAIYVNNNQNPTFDFYYNLLYQKKDGLAWKVLDELDGLTDFFNTEQLKKEIYGLRKKEDRSYTKWLMEIVNTILLNDSLNKPLNIDNIPISSPPVISGAEYELQKPNMENILGLKRNNEQELFNKVIYAAPDTMLLQNSENKKWYISLSTDIKFEVDENNAEILDLFKILSKNEQTVQHILAQHKNNTEKLTVFITEGLKSGILLESD